MSNWQIASTDPVIAPGQLNPPWDAARAGAGHVIKRDYHYLMAYWATNAAGEHHIVTAHAPLDSPNQWRGTGRALIGPQPDRTWNCRGPGFPFLLPVTESRWLLYFTAWGKREDGKLANTTGVAISEDAGDSWRYHDQHPILPLDRDYDRQGTGSVWVMREGDRYRMYYTAIGRYFTKPQGVTTGHGETIPHIGIAYAESDDGLHWRKPCDHWVITPRGFEVQPYEYIVSKPCVIKHAGGCTMWVNTFGHAYRVHRLTSLDGLNWNWSPRIGPDGELGTGEPGAFDDHQRSYPTVIVHRGKHHCWYTGNGFGTTGMGYASADDPVHSSHA